MFVWTAANQKGGVGKTTTIITLAGILALSGKKVLMLDTDPHSSLTSCFNYDSDELDCTLYDVLINPEITYEEVKKAILPSGTKNLFLLPGAMTLATLDRELGQKNGGGLVLKKALNFIKNDFDVVLIDCPPVLGVMMVNALAASSLVIVPIQTEFLALKGLECMVKTFDLLHTSSNKNIHYIIVPTMFDRRTHASCHTLDTIRKTYADNAWHDVVPVDTKLRDACELHVPASVKFPDSRGSLAYGRLLQDLFRIESGVSIASLKSLEKDQKHDQIIGENNR